MTTIATRISTETHETLATLFISASSSTGDPGSTSKLCNTYARDTDGVDGTQRLAHTLAIPTAEGSRVYATRVA